MLNILNLFRQTNNDITVSDVVFGKANTYDLKIPYSFNEPQKLTLKRDKITEPFSIEVLEVCDDDYTFVVNPKCRIQTTKNGGTIKVLRLSKGYEISDLEYSTESKGPSIKVGVEGGGVGVNISTDNLTKKGFKVHMGKLTHEHVVIITNAILRRSIFSKHDSAKINVEYIKLRKEVEKGICDAIEYQKTQKFLNPLGN